LELIFSRNGLKSRFTTKIAGLGDSLFFHQAILSFSEKKGVLKQG